jgi:hypothetical protein
MSSRNPRKTIKPKTRKTIKPKTRKTIKPKTRKVVQPVKPSTSASPATKNIKIDSNIKIINENKLLRSNFSKQNTELVRAKKSNETLVRQNNSLLSQITKLENQQKITKEKDIPIKTNEIFTLKQNLQLVQKEKIQLQNKNKISEKKIKDAMIRIADLERQLKKKGVIPMVQPIAKTEFTNIFKEIIENFNQQTIGEIDAKMDYIISDMDVELKTQVSYDSKGKMVLGTPNIENIEKAKDSLSVMKFKIRPVPRTKMASIQ